MVRAGAGLVAAVAKTDVPPSSSVAPAARVSRGGAVALHPMCWPSPRLGPSSTVAPLVGEGSGVQPKGCGPQCEVSAFGLRPSSPIIKWTLKVKNFLVTGRWNWALLKTLDVSKGGPMPGSNLRSRPQIF